MNEEPSHTAEPQSRVRRDPLIDEKKPLVQRLLASAGGLVFAGLLHVVAAVGLMTLAPHCATDLSDETDEDSIVEVAVVETEPEPPPAEIAPQPTPEPEAQEEAAPKPEPDPEPKPDPEPEPDPDPEPREPTEQPKLGIEDAPEDVETPEEPPDEPVNLEGLTMESTSDSSDGPAMRVGSGIRSGKSGSRIVAKGSPEGTPEGEGSGPAASSDGDGEGGGVTRDAKPVSRPKAPSSEYPPEALRRGIGGEVVAILTVDKTGKVIRVDIKKGVTPELDKLAEKYLRKWQFQPAMENGRAVQTEKRVEYVFEVSNR